MLYLDNAATGIAKPDCVIEAACTAMKFAANPGRSGHKLSVACLERVFNCRELLRGFLGGRSAERVIFTKNCTEALNMAILGVADSLRGQRIITTVAEHNSVLRPLEELKRRGAEVDYIPLDDGGDIDLNILEGAARGGKPPRAAVITLASNVTGTSPDIRRVRAALPDGCILICDGAQACGHVDIDMHALGIDALAVAGHKGMLGIQGSGALLLSERFNPSPIMFGGTGSESFSPYMPDFYPDRLEAGTLNYPAIVSLGEGVNYLKEHMAEHAPVMTGFTRAAVDLLKQIEGVKVYSRPNPFGTVAFSLENMQSEGVAYALSEKFGIYVRGGLHCAPLMHRALGSTGLVRASFSPFTPKCAAEELARAVKKLAYAK